jgi:AraC family transcriptional regulator
MPFTEGHQGVVSSCVGGVAFSDVRFPALTAQPEHEHPLDCVTVLLEGDIDLKVARVERVAVTGQLRTLPRGVPHTTAFGPSGARVFSAEIDELRTLSDGAAASSVLGTTTDVRHPEISTVAWRIVHELRNPDGVTPLALEAHLLHLLAGAARLSQGDVVRRDKPAWLLAAHDLVRDRFLEDLRLGDVADAVGVHPAHLARGFRNGYGAPLGDFVRRLRLGWAASRLVGSVDPISVIARQAGFSDQAHFTRAFSRYAGLPPNQFRRSRVGGHGQPPA